MKSELPGDLYGRISSILQEARQSAYRAVNFAMVVAYWEIGKRIVEHEQGGNAKAGYGEGLLKDLSQKLTADFGKGFTFKDPYVLEFLALPSGSGFLEKDLENAIMQKLQQFLLELDKGFSFVAQQKRISAGDEHFYVDLPFYNYILK